MTKSHRPQPRPRRRPNSVETRVGRIEKSVATLESDVSVLKTDVSVLKTDVSVLKTDVSVLRTDVSVLKTDVRSLREDLATLEVKVDANEAASCRRDAQILAKLDNEIAKPLAELRDFVKRVADNHEVRITALERA